VKDLNFFQLGLLGAFMGAGVLGVILFATFRGGGGDESFKSEIVMWGTLHDDDVDDLVDALKDKVGKDNFKVSYIEKRKENFEFELLNALASGTGPDIFLVPQDEILKYEDKIFLLSFETYPERIFKDTFIEEGELYLRSNGVLALPFSIDPMILYWNRTMLTSAGVPSPPKSWNELFDLARVLSLRDESRNIIKSAVALGEFANVSHAKDIISVLTLQAGNAIVHRDLADMPVSVFSQRTPGASVSSAEAALRFFIEFSNPVKPTYSWNRSLPLSTDAFTAGDLALYLGYASERSALRAKNANINFDTTGLPQALDTGVKATFGRMQAVAIAKNTPHISDAFRAATILSSKDAGEIWTEISGLPPVRRDLLAQKPVDAFGAVLYDSALQSRAWLDPNPQETDAIFRDMIEASISGREKISEAVNRADRELQELLR
jgi:ABC-type glycerol-3-phosphate transport system substrate-binding protein